MPVSSSKEHRTSQERQKQQTGEGSTKGWACYSKWSAHHREVGVQGISSSTHPPPKKGKERCFQVENKDIARARH